MSKLNIFDTEGLIEKVSTYSAARGEYFTAVDAIAAGDSTELAKLHRNKMAEAAIAIAIHIEVCVEDAA